jgi:hypothetical protein
MNGFNAFDRITEQLFYSEFKNCDWLKEVVMDEVFKNISFNDGPGFDQRCSCCRREG